MRIWLCKNKWLRRFWQNVWFLTNFATFLRLNEKNSLVYDKNNLKVNRVPKMELFYKILSKNPDWAFFDRLNATDEYQKIVRKDVSSFSENAKKLSKSRLFLGCCNGKTNIYDQVILGTPQFIWNLFSNKLYAFIICVLSEIEVFPKRTLPKNIAFKKKWSIRKSIKMDEKPLDRKGAFLIARLD